MRKALIVDDSKTARHSLCLLLERMGFDVHMLESAEAALEYLRDQVPDLVFMDHMMPGMDGFQAVKAIKSDPRTADLPIIMYTGRDGEVYFGQAHALGAADILTKPARIDDLTAVLERLQAKTAALLEPAATEAPELVEAAPPVPTGPARAAAPLLAGSAIPTLTDEPAPGPQPETAAPGVAVQDRFEPAGAERRLFWPIALLLLALLPAVWLLSLYLPTEHQREELVQRERQLYRTLEWSLGRAGAYPYGEPAMAGQRLELLQGLVSQLSALGFRGLIRLKVHVGDFCVVADGERGWRLAPPALPVTECGALGMPAAEALALSEYQGRAFGHFIEESPLLADDRIRVEWMGYGSSSPREDYPLDAEQIDAGGWNSIAARNQRIEFELRPEPPAPPHGFWWAGR